MEPRRILFIRTDRLGETVLTLPVVTAMRAAYPQAYFIMLVHPDMAALLEGMPGVSELWQYEPDTPRAWYHRAARLSMRLRRGAFDLVLVCNPKKEFHAAVRLAGITRRVGYGRKFGWCLTDRLPDRTYTGDRHEVDYNLDLVRQLGLPVGEPAWRMPAFDRERDELRSQARLPTPFVAVHPWTSNPLKQWPAGRYRELIARIAAQVPVVMIGGPETRAQAAGALPQAADRVTDLAGRTSLRQLAAVLQDASLLVSNDSGPVHLAAALGTKTVALFGGTDPATGPRRWGPWGAGHTVISRPSLEEITVDEVVTAVQRALHVTA